MPTTTSLGRHRRHSNPFSLRQQTLRIDPDSHLQRRAPLALDIGCGPGAFVHELCEGHPEWNVLGLEIRPHLVDFARASLEQAERRHADVLLANANLQLSALLPDACLRFVSLNFPDPWFKKRHHKRRVITASMCQVLARKMRQDGELHVMTDVPELAHAMRATLRAAGFVDAFDDDGWPEASTTSLHSERELWHLGRGDRVWRLLFRPPGARPDPR